MVFFKRLWFGLKFILTKIFVLFITLFVLFVLFPMWAVLFGPIYIFRLFVSKIASRFRPKLGKMLTARSTMYGSEDFYRSSGKPSNNITCVLKLKGDFDLEEYIKHIEDKVVYAKDEHGELLRPEIQQFVTPFCGFLFWQWIDHFNIRDHIEFHDSPEKSFTDQDILNLERLQLRTPHTPGRSPWKVIIIKNYSPEDDPQNKEKKFVCILSLNHCLADGYSIFKIFLQLTTRTDENSPADQTQKKLMASALEAFERSVRVPGPLEVFTGTFQFLENVITSYDYNEYHSTFKYMSRDIQIAEVNPIPLQILKDIKSIYNVGLTSVILEGVTGGIRNFMLKNGVKIPENMHVGVPLPVPGHPDKLRNHMTCCLIRLPVGNPDRRQRILLIESYLEKIKHSLIPKAFFVMWLCFGSLFTWMVRILAKNLITTVVLSSFPGPGQLRMINNEVFDVHFGSGLLSGATGIIFACVSYNEMFKITTQIDSSIVKNDQQANELLQFIIQEFDLLRKDNFNTV